VEEWNGRDSRGRAFNGKQVAEAPHTVSTLWLWERRLAGST